MKRNVMILGTNGMLGSMLVKRWSEVASFRLFAGVRSSVAPELAGRIKAVLGGMDAMAFDKVEQERLAYFIGEHEVSVLVNCIGVIKQRAGGQDPITTITVNALFPHQLAKVCSSTGTRLIHVSTDCVFSGEKGAYLETDMPDAQDFYGRSKALGEVTEPNLTLRTSIIGPEMAQSEGLGLLTWLLRQRGQNVPGYTRAIFSGVTTLTLADLMAEIILNQPKFAGLFHVASEPIDKFTLLKKANRIFGLGLEIIADSTLRIDRSLNARSISAHMGYTPPPWDDQLEALSRYITR